MKVNVTLGTIWQDRGNEKKFEVTGINQETGVLQISAVGNGDGYRTMTEASLHKNYKLVALEAPKTTAKTETHTEPTPTPEPPQQPAQREAPPKEKEGRAAVGRVQLKDGTIIAGSKFITETCQQKREDTYKVDSPIRWLLKPTGQAFLKTHDAKVVYGEKVTK